MPGGLPGGGGGGEGMGGFGIDRYIIIITSSGTSTRYGSHDVSL